MVAAVEPALACREICGHRVWVEREVVGEAFEGAFNEGRSVWPIVLGHEGDHAADVPRWRSVLVGQI